VRLWSQRRFRLSHDHIRNKLLPALGAAENGLRGLAEIQVNEVLDEAAHTWEFVRMEALDLANRFLSEMSPKVLFEESPLFLCNQETLDWLAPFAHERWATRNAVSDLLSRLEKNVVKTDSAFQKLAQERNDGASEAGAQTVLEARKAVTRLARQLSTFPSRIYP
jgi:hypothetical protein